MASHSSGFSSGFDIDTGATVTPVVLSMGQGLGALLRAPMPLRGWWGLNEVAVGLAETITVDKWERPVQTLPPRAALPVLKTGEWDLSQFLASQPTSVAGDNLVYVPVGMSAFIRPTEWKAVGL